MTEQTISLLPSHLVVLFRQVVRACARVCKMHVMTYMVLSGNKYGSRSGGLFRWFFITLCQSASFNITAVTLTTRVQ